MYDPSIITYVAFALLVIIGLIVIQFIHCLSCLRPSFSIKFHNCEAKVYYYVIASLLATSYFTVSIVLLALTVSQGPRWEEWSWRWSVGGALLDSICAIKSTREWSGILLPRVIYYQITMASIEVVLVVILPAIPYPAIRTYLNLAVIICHSLWTALSAWSWTCERKRMLRWVASAGQAVGAVASIWSPLTFVVVFFALSLSVCVEELNDSQQSFWRIGSPQERTDRETNRENKYNVVFFGKCSKRTDYLRQVIGWSWSTRSNLVGGVDLFQHPTLKEVQLASVPPYVSLSLIDKNTYIQAFMRSASAIVLILDLLEQQSWEYIKTLQGLSEGETILLVACNHQLADMQDKSNEARQYAGERGWDFSTVDELDSAFLTLMTRMHTRPPSRAGSLGVAGPSSQV